MIQHRIKFHQETIAQYFARLADASPIARHRLVSRHEFTLRAN